MFNKINNHLESISDIFNNISKVLLSIIIATMAGIIIMQVFLRYVLNTGFGWPEEVTMFLMAWMTFIGSAIGVKYSQHISIEILDRILPVSIQSYVIFLAKIVTLIFTLIFTYFGYFFVIGSLGYKANTVPISLFWPRLSLLIGGLLMSFHLLVFILRDIEAGVKK